jgi:hypothetical protein
MIGYTVCSTGAASVALTILLSVFAIYGDPRVWSLAGGVAVLSGFLVRAWHNQRPEVFARRTQKLREESWEWKHVVIVEPESVTVTDPDGKSSSILWSELERVRVVTTDRGPVVCDFWWVLDTSDSGITVPQGAQGLDRAAVGLFVWCWSWNDRP